MQVELPDVETTLNIGPGRVMDDEEFFALCAQNRKLRIERESSGEIVIMPPGGLETGYQNNEICRQLGNWAIEDGRGVALDSNTEFLLSDGSGRAPDASWLSNRRLAAFSKEEKKRFLHVCPEFVVELTSPSDRLSRVMAKMQQWIANGAELGWLLDAATQTAYIYRPGRDVEVLPKPDVMRGEGPVSGFVLELGRIWRGLE